MSTPKVFRAGGLVHTGIANLNDEALMADMLDNIREELTNGAPESDLIGRFPELSEQIREIANQLNSTGGHTP